MNLPMLFLWLDARTANTTVQGDGVNCIAVCSMITHFAVTARGRGESMTWGDLYKRFAKDYPKAKAVDYRPFTEGYLPTRRQGIIIWLENGDVLVYMPKVAEKKEE